MLLFARKLNLTLPSCYFFAEKLTYRFTLKFTHVPESAFWGT